VNAVKFPEKLKLIRRANNQTQEKFAQLLGISRGFLSGLELGKVQPSQLLINCVSLMFNIDRNWLMNDSDNDLSAINGSSGLIYQIMEQYEKLNGPYKKFVENQIKQLLEIQNSDQTE
jgi:transcriptional regulator with XRE-family HTH domain